MRKIITLGIMLLFLGMTISSTGFNLENQSIKPLSSGNILYVGGSGTGNYSKIQDAIDNASNGDTVFVYAYSSPYYENLIVDKSINLIGEDRDTTVIDGKAIGTVIDVNADWVHITSLTIRNSKFASFPEFFGGIHLKSNNCIISNNYIIENEGDGIILHNSNDNNINNNIIEKNRDGFKAWDSNNNIIHNNVLRADFDHWGIYLVRCSSNVVSENTVSKFNTGISDSQSSDNVFIKNRIFDNEGEDFGLYESYNVSVVGNFIERRFGSFQPWLSGLYLTDIYDAVIIDNIFVSCGINVDYGYSSVPSSSLIIENNTVNGKPLVVLVGKTGQIIDTAGQVVLINCTNCTIKELEINNLFKAIILCFSSYNTVTKNHISGCNIGIFIQKSYENNMLNNIIKRNVYGINLDKSDLNTISYNIFNLNIYGIDITKSVSNNLEYNSLKGNGYGIYGYKSSNITVERNTFFLNLKQASFLACELTLLFRNFWNRPRLSPKLIFSYSTIEYISHSWDIDWRPALFPYDIGV